MGRGAGGRTRAEIDAAFDALGTSLDVVERLRRRHLRRRRCSRRSSSRRWRCSPTCSCGPTSPRARPTSCKRELAAQLDELRDDDGQLVRRFFTRALYGAHPYGRTVIGTEASLKARSTSTARAPGTSARSPAATSSSASPATSTPSDAARGDRAPLRVAAGGRRRAGRAPDGDAARGHAPDARRQAGAHAVADPHRAAGAALARPRLPGAAGGDHRVRRHLHGAPDGRGALQARPVVRRLGARRPGARRQVARGARVPVAGADAGDAGAGAAAVARVGRRRRDRRRGRASRAATWPRASPSAWPRPKIGWSCARRSSCRGCRATTPTPSPRASAKVERARRGARARRAPDAARPRDRHRLDGRRAVAQAARRPGSSTASPSRSSLTISTSACATTPSSTRSRCDRASRRRAASAAAR